MANSHPRDDLKASAINDHASTRTSALDDLEAPPVCRNDTKDCERQTSVVVAHFGGDDDPATPPRS